MRADLALSIVFGRAKLMMRQQQADGDAPAPEAASRSRRSSGPVGEERAHIGDMATLRALFKQQGTI